jgi:cyclopropane-fatty-acyl-phospholipid synthase
MKSATAIQQTATVAASTAESTPVFQRLVVGLLEPMRKGRLTLELPNGASIRFGDRAAGASPNFPAGVASEARIIVRDSRFFRRCVLSGDVGFGESYVTGEWDSPDVVAVIAWFLLNIDHAPTLSGSARRRVHGWVLNLMRFSNRAGHLMRRNTLKTARRNIHAHYDVSNAFLEKMLDPSMMY